MKIKTVICIFAMFLLANCGYEPIYSKKKLDTKYNFTIKSVEFSGENKINSNLKNNLTNYIDIENKLNQYDLKISSFKKRTITSKNKKGNPDVYSIKTSINVEIYENDKLLSQKIFDESFEYKNKSSKFELNKYENSIIKNLVSKLAEQVVNYLYSIK
tara:strand:+ start:3785 stop:4258 length:474 start_codon:yes stop_codon:yes gene_type:complete